MNTKTYIEKELLKIDREGMKDLLEYMNGKNSFFAAPGSTKFHSQEEGGLAQHTVNVMKMAHKIAKTVLSKKDYENMKESITLTAALHDLGKMGQFEKPYYSPNYLKSGELSSAKPYVTNKGLLYIDHSIRSVSIAQMFISLTEDEQFAILYHDGMYGPLKYALEGKETPLFMILHWADMWSSRVIEKGEE